MSRDQVELDAIQYFVAYSAGKSGEAAQSSTYQPTEAERVDAALILREGRFSLGRGLAWVLFAVVSVAVIVLTCFVPGTNPVTTGLLGVVTATAVGYSVDEFRKAKEKRREAVLILRGLW